MMTPQHITTDDRPGYYYTAMQNTIQVLALDTTISIPVISDKAKKIGLRYIFSEDVPCADTTRKATAIYFEVLPHGQFQGFKDMTWLD